MTLIEFVVSSPDVRDRLVDGSLKINEAWCPNWLSPSFNLKLCIFTSGLHLYSKPSLQTLGQVPAVAVQMR